VVPQLGLVGPAEARSEQAADQTGELVEWPTEPSACGRLRSLTRVSAASSDLDVDDATDNERSGHDHDSGHQEQEPTAGICVERRHVGRVDQSEQEE